jgi:hypothetical protein
MKRMSFYISERLKERVRRVPILRPVLGAWWRWSMMRSQQLPREWFDGSIDGFVAEDLFDVAFAFHSENPDPAGCPDLPVLRELASRRRPMDDPWFRHLQSCSNCYRQVRGLQQAPWLWRRTRPRKSRR